MSPLRIYLGHGALTRELRVGIFFQKCQCRGNLRNARSVRTRFELIFSTRYLVRSVLDSNVPAKIKQFSLGKLLPSHPAIISSSMNVETCESIISPYVLVEVTYLIVSIFCAPRLALAFFPSDHIGKRALGIFKIHDPRK